ncbi:MAG: DUF1259 domain-containing protein [Afipia sp.]
MRILGLLLLGATLVTVAHGQEIQWAQVDEVLGRTATVTQDVHRYGFPRTDLHVTLDGVAIKPAFALGGWVAFKPMGNQAMVMGDLVLTESEVNPVMARVLADGMEVTAVHNHLLRASPATFYMHIGGHGDPVKMALTIREALVLSKTPGVVVPATTGAPAALDLDTAKLDEAIGVKGRATGGVYQFGVPRADVISDDGMVVPAALGSAHAINFQPTGNGKTAITGDFVALAKEVNPLISTLRSNGIEVTAIHNHMLMDEPRTFFIHFWANDDAVQLASGLRAALEKTNVPPKAK